MLPVKAWGGELGRFLSWLHRVPVGEAAALGVQEGDVAGLLDEATRDAIEDLDAVSLVASVESVERWRDWLLRPPAIAQDVPLVLTHGDLAAEHVLYEPESMRLTGVIDWSEMAISDAAVDLAALFHWGGRPLLDAALTTYGDTLEDTLVRARYFGACRGAADVAFGLKMNRPEYVHAGLRALELCMEP
jgi:aminoglycoside phosphotransferase (APT) family kinase protein